ncbi:MAG: cyclic nucleotide-binding domain-containing protein [Terriglobales bacterium]|jgi:CRP-like cAMP-binding protein
MAAGANLLVSEAMRSELLQRAKFVLSEAKGTVLFRRDDAVRGLFLIRRGRVSVAQDTGSVEYPPRILGPGAVVGLPATVAGSAYKLTAEVVDQAELAFVPRTEMLSCLQHNVELCFEVMTLLSGEISGTHAALKRTGSGREPAA